MKGKHWSIVAILVLLNYLVFSQLIVLVVESTKPEPTPTRTPKPTFTPTFTPSPIPPPPPTPTPPPPPTPTATRVVPPTDTPTPEGGPTSTPPPEATATPVPAETRTGRTTHVVQPGENLSQIAQRYGVSVEAIVQVNGLEDPSLIHTGQTLIIPAPGEVPPTATPRPPTATAQPAQPTAAPPMATSVPTALPATQQPAFQYTPTGWWGAYNPGLTRFMGEIKDTAGQPVNGVFVRAVCGDWATISFPSGPVGWGPMGLSSDWPSGFYDITVANYPQICMWTLQVVDTDDRVTVKAELSEAVPIEVSNEKSVITANWQKNW